MILALLLKILYIWTAGRVIFGGVSIIIGWRLRFWDVPFLGGACLIPLSD